VAALPEDPDVFVQRLQALHDRVAPQFPDIDPGDLLLILKALLRPAGARRRLFLRRIRPNVYVI
jgi:hypothetical protein